MIFFISSFPSHEVFQGHFIAVPINPPVFVISEIGTVIVLISPCQLRLEDLIVTFVQSVAVMIPACPYLAKSGLFGSGIHTAVFPTVGVVIEGLILLDLEAHVLHTVHAPTISLTYSPHSFHPFGFVVSERREGIIVESGAERSVSPVAHFQFPVAVLTIASAWSGVNHFPIRSILDDCISF